MNTLNTSTTLNSFDLTALSTTVSSGFLARYLKTEVDALLATTDTHINLKVNTTDNTAALALKQDTITGLLTNFLTSNGTNNRVLISDSTGKLATSSIKTTELFCLANVSSNIQTQINTHNTNITELTTTILNIYNKTQVDALLDYKDSFKL